MAQEFQVVGQSKVWTAALIVIGDEILSGRTEDKNVAQLARWLNGEGIRLAEVRVVADIQQHIVAAVNALRPAHDYVFTTGGIGPTHDDITVDAIAAAFDVPVIIHPEARAILEEYYASRGGITDARLRMARVPAGAELIPNPTSGAPGVRIGNVFILAGVPHIAARMLEALTGKLAGGKPMVSATVSANATESEVAALLSEVQDQHPGVAIGSYPFYREGGFGADFVVRSDDESLVRACVEALTERLSAAGYEPQEGA